MKIAIDLDDTLFKNNVVTDTCKEMGYEGTWSWDLHEIPQNILSVIYDRFNDPEYMCNLIPFEGNQECIKEMSLTNELYVVTARKPNVYEQTVKMVNKYFPEITNIYFGNDSKRDILIHENFRMLIDDSPKYIEEIMDLPIDKVLISNENTKYNHKLAESCKDISVATSLADFWRLRKKWIK